MLRSVASLLFVVAASPTTFGSSNDTCNVLPPQHCWENPLGKIDSISGIGSDPQLCCQLCSSATDCLTWNHGMYNTSNGTYTCDLYHDIGPSKTTSDGCSGGFRRPAVPRTDRPNIVFLVVESTDGRTWQRGYSNDLIPLPAIRQLQNGGVAFHRHYANAPVSSFWLYAPLCCPKSLFFISSARVFAGLLPKPCNVLVWSPRA